MRTTIKHPVPNGIKLSFVIFDIQALWRSGLSRWLIMKTAVYMSRDHEEVDGRVRVTWVMKSERAEQRSDQVALIVRLSDCVSDTSLYCLRSVKLSRWQNRTDWCDRYWWVLSMVYVQEFIFIQPIKWHWHIYVRPILSTQSSLTNTAARRFSCCAPTVWNSVPSFVRTADSFTSFRSHLKTYMFARHCARSAVRASDTFTLSFARYKLLTFLLTYLPLI